MTTYEHHEYANIFPLLNGEKLKELVDSIRKSGLIDPITLHEGKILDGRNRARACAMAGVVPRYVEWTSVNGESALDFVVARNLHRRDLTESQRAMAAQKATALYAAEARARQVAAGAHGVEGGRGSEKPLPRMRGKGLNPHASNTSHKVAKQFKVSPRAVEAAGRVARKGVPELVAAVESGMVSVYQADFLATAPPAEQRAAIAGGDRSIKDAAGKIRRSQGSKRGNRVVLERGNCKALRDMARQLRDLTSTETFEHWKFGTIRKLADEVFAFVGSITTKNKGT